jgi:hypothetical protein
MPLLSSNKYGRETILVDLIDISTKLDQPSNACEFAVTASLEKLLRRVDRHAADPLTSITTQQPTTGMLEELCNHGNWESLRIGYRLING